MIDPMPTERVVVDREFPCSSLNRRTRSEQPFDPHPGSGRSAGYRNYPPGMLRLKDANIGSVAFKKATVFNSIQVPHRVQLIPP